MTTTKTEGTENLVRVRSVKGELLEDREVGDPADDQLDHTQLAQQLADLAMSAPDPSNIALYGAWGSGKSGIGRLLQLQLAEKQDIGFARFDAFKYAENPLRRNFVSAVATELGLHHDEYHADLYSGKTTTDFKVPPARLVRLAITFLLLALVISAGLLAIVAIIAVLQAGEFGDNFKLLSKSVVTAALAPAALLAALIALAGRSLGVERRIDKADSDEQFEKVFASLLARAKKRRVIVFVDELDRCAPAEVVATLDAVRTFLGVRGCIFVVAADRQVLEEALTTDVRQATPADAVNPYYSSGSAYLDKVFQYQVIVPPLLQHSITRFALDLVKGRPGVWSELGQDLNVAVSILVPSHVRSPRRVKNLLNAFVLAYRLTEARQRTHRLEGDVRGRADEIARLVCFRAEFPLFARHLLLDWRLPDYVLRLHERDEAVWDDYPHTTLEVREVARKYAEVSLPVATLLADAGDAGDEDHRAHAESSDAGNGHVLVERKLGQQLLDYLSRTRTVRGPARDLLYMQSTGSVVGLTAATAEDVERLASNRDLRSITTLLEQLDDAEKQAVLSLLIEQSRSAIGLELRNTAESLLAVGGTDGLDLALRADSVAEALSPALAAFPDVLSASGLPGAWNISLNAHRDAGLTLRSMVLRHPASSEPGVAGSIIANAGVALDTSAAETARIVSAQLTAEAAQAMVKQVGALPPAVAARLLRECREQLVAALRGLVDIHRAGKAAQTASTPAPATPGVTKPGAEPTPDPDWPQVLEALGTLLDALEPGSDGPKQVLVETMLEVDYQDVRDLIEPRLSSIGSVEDPAVGHAMLRACERRVMSLWPLWLAPLNAGGSRPSDTSDPLERLISKMWTEVSAGAKRPERDEIADAAAALVRLVEFREPTTQPSLGELAYATITTPVTDDEEATERLALHDAIEPLMTSGLLSRSVVARAEVAALRATLGATIAEREIDSPLVRYIDRSVRRAAVGWSAGEGSEVPKIEDRVALIDAVSESTWLPEPLATGLPIIVRRAADDLRDEPLPPLPTASQVVELHQRFGAAADEAFASWLETTTHCDSAEVPAVVAEVSSRPTSDLVAALGAFVAAGPGLSIDPVALLEGVSGDPGTAVPPADVVQVLVSGRVSDTDVAAVLVSRYERCANNAQRRQTLELWRRCNLSAEAARRTLVTRILTPLFALNAEGANVQAAEIGVEYLVSLADPLPFGVKKSLGEAVIGATQNGSVEGKAVEALRRLGYRTSRSGILRRRTHVDTSGQDSTEGDNEVPPLVLPDEVTTSDGPGNAAAPGEQPQGHNS